MYTDKYRMTYAALRYILLSCAMAAGEPVTMVLSGCYTGVPGCDTC